MVFVRSLLGLNCRKWTGQTAGKHSGIGLGLQQGSTPVFTNCTSERNKHYIHSDNGPATIRKDLPQGRTF